MAPYPAHRPPHLVLVRERPAPASEYQRPRGYQRGGEADPVSGYQRPEGEADLVSEHQRPEGEADLASEDQRAEGGGALDDLDNLDALEDLGDRIAVLAAHIHAATHQLLTLVAEFDRLRGWEAGGHRSCAHWLAFRTGIDLGAAREKVRTARALTALPETSASMARGRLSFSQVRALTRVATPESESDLLELARGCTTAQLERVVRAWKRGSRTDEAALERDRHESRTLAVFPDDDGMYVVKGRLDPEVGALLMRAVEAASDALFRERGAAGRESTAPGCDDAPYGHPDDISRRAAAQRRADALGLLAERAMAVGFGGQERSGREDRSGGDDRSGSEDHSGSDDRSGGEEDRLGEDRSGGGSAHATEAPISGTRAARYQVVLHVDAETLSENGKPGRSDLEDGTRGRVARGVAPPGPSQIRARRFPPLGSSAEESYGARAQICT